MPVVLPLALLCGLAADGFYLSRGRDSCFAALVAAIALISSSFTIRSKVDGLRDAGDRATLMLNQINGLVAPGDGRQIALLYLNSDLNRDRTYSIYHVRCDGLLGLQYVEALYWMRPGAGLRFTPFFVDRVEDWHASGFDIVLAWDETRQQFTRVTVGVPARPQARLKPHVRLCTDLREPEGVAL